MTMAENEAPGAHCAAKHYDSAQTREVIERAIRFIETGSHTQIARDTMTDELRKVLATPVAVELPTEAEIHQAWTTYSQKQRIGKPMVGAFVLTVLERFAPLALEIERLKSALKEANEACASEHRDRELARAELQRRYDAETADGRRWFWQGDGSDHLESMVNGMQVIIGAAQLRALLAGSVATRLPHGWALVPVAPTEEMLHAPDIGRIVPASTGETAKRWERRRKDYSAMLSRAPVCPRTGCATCNDAGMIGGRSGQTAESYEEWAEPCPDCAPTAPALTLAMREHLMAGVMALSEFQRDNPWVSNTKAILAGHPPGSAAKRECTCGSGPGGGHSRTCLMFDESMMRYDPFSMDAAPAATRAQGAVPAGYSIGRVEGHGWLIDPPSGSRWVAHENTPAGDFMAAILATPAQGGEAMDIDAAARTLAECMDYPWGPMPEQGRQEMKKHAQRVIDAAKGGRNG